MVSTLYRNHSQVHSRYLVLGRDGRGITLAIPGIQEKKNVVENIKEQLNKRRRS